MEQHECGSVKELELFSAKARCEDYTWVSLTLQKIGVDLPRLLDVYNRIYLAKEAVWLTAGDEFHILRVLSSIIAMFAESPSTVNNHDRRQFTVVCQVFRAFFPGWVEDFRMTLLK